jgi:hypothetical protein
MTTKERRMILDLQRTIEKLTSFACLSAQGHNGADAVSRQAVALKLERESHKLVDTLLGTDDDG